MIELALNTAFKTHIRRCWPAEGAPVVFGAFEPIPPQTTFPYLTLSFTKFHGDELSGSGYGTGETTGILTLWTSPEQASLRGAFLNAEMGGLFAFEKIDRFKGVGHVHIIPGSETIRKDKYLQTNRFFKLYFEETPYDLPA